MNLLRQVLRAKLAVLALVFGVVLGNVVTMWLSAPPPPTKHPAPRTWDWDPFANPLRFT